MSEENKYSHSIFFIDVDKIEPNPFQPRKEFAEEALASLAESIRQYGVLQPLVVTRKERVKDDGGIVVTYELIAGERRLRASKKAGILQVPAVIRHQEDDDKVKLEIAIIENIQREDLNPVDRARAFHQLANLFSLTHTEISKKIGKSREYVSNSIRILGLPEHILQAVLEGKISEGHTRPILMLNDRPEQQSVLFNDIIKTGMTVREAESFSRRIAQDKVRRAHLIFDKNTIEIEERLAEKLGTRVRIEKKEKGGKILIDFFSAEDLENILKAIYDTSVQKEESLPEEEGNKKPPIQNSGDEDLYSIRNFSI